MADDLMLTLTGSDWLGVVLAVVAATFLGFLWFTPLFGKRWAREMGMDTSDRPSPRRMALSMVLFIFGNLLMAYVLWHEIHGWIPTLWAEQLGIATGDVENSSVWMYASLAALFNWLGFMLPLQLGRVAWENRSWTLVAINAGFDIVRLFAMAYIVAALSGQV